MVRDAGFYLPGSPEAARMGIKAYADQGSWDGDESIKGSWEDLSLGVATIWKGIKL